MKRTGPARRCAGLPGIGLGPHPQAGRRCAGEGCASGQSQGRLGGHEHRNLQCLLQGGRQPVQVLRRPHQHERVRRAVSLGEHDAQPFAQVVFGDRAVVDRGLRCAVSGIHHQRDELTGFDQADRGRRVMRTLGDFARQRIGGRRQTHLDDIRKTGFGQRVDQRRRIGTGLVTPRHADRLHVAAPSGEQLFRPPHHGDGFDRSPLRARRSNFPRLAAVDRPVQNGHTDR